MNSSLTIADIQWPGGRSKPPAGKPVIYYLRVVTLQENPFVMLKDPTMDGRCQTGSVICRIGPENSYETLVGRSLIIVALLSLI